MFYVPDLIFPRKTQWHHKKKTETVPQSTYKKIARAQYVISTVITSLFRHFATPYKYELFLLEY